MKVKSIRVRRFRCLKDVSINLGDITTLDLDGTQLSSDDADSSTASSDESSTDSSNETRFEIFILDADRDGLEQITEFLGDYVDIDAIHILSHGAAGTLRLGSSLITSDELSENAALLEAWGRHVRPGGDLLLYGCNVADGEVGVAFVEELSTYTGLDVAASTDDTGLNGDWDLEFGDAGPYGPQLKESKWSKPFTWIDEECVPPERPR